MVAQFYCDITDMPRISDQEMGCAMQQLSNQHATEFDTMTALKELFIYVLKYREEVNSIILIEGVIILSRSLTGAGCVRCRRELPLSLLG